MTAGAFGRGEVAVDEPRFMVEVITLVPAVWQHLLSSESGLVGRAMATGSVPLQITDLRAFGKGTHRQVDDSPFGGGAGMVLAVEPLRAAIAQARARTPGPVVMLTPRGTRLAQSRVRGWAAGRGLILLCGRYEGTDERLATYVDEEVSVGDFVLSGGDPAAWCVVDAVVRLLPGVLGNSESLAEESFADHLLEYPQYTRPAEYEGQQVPAVLLSGDHAAVARWRRHEATRLTRRLRPDLLEDD